MNSIAIIPARGGSKGIPRKNEKTNKRSALIVSLADRFLSSKGMPILEIGCNQGRNLRALRDAGYDDLCGVEINPEAAAIASKMDIAREFVLIDGKPVKTTTYPEIMIGAVPGCLYYLRSEAWSLVFTLACLEHWPDSDRHIASLSRLTGEYLITIEDEKTDHTPRHFPRNYKTVFEGVGMKQVFEMPCNCAEHGLNTGCFMARVFKK